MDKTKRDSDLQSQLDEYVARRIEIMRAQGASEEYINAWVYKFRLDTRPDSVEFHRRWAGCDGVPHGLAGSKLEHKEHEAHKKPKTFAEEMEDRRNAMTHFFIIWHVSVVCLLLILIILSAK